MFRPVDTAGPTPELNGRDWLVEKVLGSADVLFRYLPELVETGGLRLELDCGKPVELSGRPELPVAL